LGVCSGPMLYYNHQKISCLAQHLQAQDWVLVQIIDFP
jgi:hypothetical protein